MTMGNKTIHQIAGTHRPLVFCVLMLHLVAGCSIPLERSALLKDNYPSIDRVQGPNERSLRNFFKKKEEEDRAANNSLSGKSLKPLPGTDEYLAATDLYKDEKYLEAQKAFKKVAKQYKKSEIREDALFMEAESAWQQENYSRAHDVYAVLLKEYPSTRHLNVVSERMFKLGRLWLDFPEVVKLGEIHQVNFDDPEKKLPSEEPPALPKSKPLFQPNFTNKKEPLFDTPGNGVAALTAVWMNDPTGPLADDAMMLVASYYARIGSYVESDRYFQMLRETFPNSPHVQNAFLLGSHVKLMSYQGPDYESRTLDEAQKLKEATLRLYPGIPEKERLQEELAHIEDSKALETYSQVNFWLRKGNKRAAAIYCHQTIAKYPNSQYAKKAHAKLVELGPQYSSGAVFLAPVDPKKKSILDSITPKLPSVEFKLKNSPLVAAPRNKSNNSPKTNSKDDNKQPKRIDDSNDAEPEESLKEAEPAPKDEPANPPKRRRGWYGDDGSPDRLPPGSESEAKELNSKAPGRARL